MKEMNLVAIATVMFNGLNALKLRKQEKELVTDVLNHLYAYQINGNINDCVDWLETIQETHRNSTKVSELVKSCLYITIDSFNKHVK